MVLKGLSIDVCIISRWTSVICWIFKNAYLPTVPPLCPDSPPSSTLFCHFYGGLQSSVGFSKILTLPLFPVYHLILTLP